MIKHILGMIFSCYRENGHLVIRIFGFKIRLKSLKINRLEKCCCIPNLSYYKKQKTFFIHPIGVVIHPDVKIGLNCTIYQNVTIGNGKYNIITKRSYPIIGNNVTIYANAVIIGGINIGDNAIIGAGAVVVKDVQANTTVVGNPAQKVLNNNFGSG